MKTSFPYICIGVVFFFPINLIFLLLLRKRTIKKIFCWKISPFFRFFFLIIKLLLFFSQYVSSFSRVPSAGISPNRRISLNHAFFYTISGRRGRLERDGQIFSIKICINAKNFIFGPKIAKNNYPNAPRPFNCIVE